MKNYLISFFLLCSATLLAQPASNNSVQDYLSQNKRFASTPDKNFYIFICVGQSNMEGAVKPEDQDYEWSDDRFQVMAATDYAAHAGNHRGEERQKFQWYTAVPPLCRQNTGLTPIDYFGRTVVQNLPDSIRIGVIHVAVGGCCIEHLFKEYDPRKVVREPDWFQGFMSGYDAFPYARLLDCALRASHQGVFKGILLHQGCSNTGDKQWPAKVNKFYTDLLSDIHMTPEEVPLIAGEVLDKDAGGACASMNSIINTLPQTIPTSSVISSAGLLGMPDRLHFTAEGYRELGRRYAKAWLDYYNAKQK